MYTTTQGLTNGHRDFFHPHQDRWGSQADTAKPGKSPSGVGDVATDNSGRFGERKKKVVLPEDQLVALLSELDGRRPFVDLGPVYKSISRSWRRSGLADLTFGQAVALAFMWSGIILATVYASKFFTLAVFGMVKIAMQ